MGREAQVLRWPSPGMVVLRVGSNDKPGSSQTRVQPVPAHGLPPSRGGVFARPTQAVWPQRGHTELTVAGARLANIRLVDDVAHFDVGRAPEREKSEKSEK